MASRATKQRPLGALGILRVVGLTLLSGMMATQAWAADEVDVAESSIEVTWKGLLETIDREHPLMHAARAGLDGFRAKLGQAQWAYFPTFKLEAGATVMPTILGDSDKTEYDWSRPGYFVTAKLKMVQPVYTFGKISALKQAARRGVDVGRAQVDVARWELVYRAAQAWNGELLSRELGEILNAGKKWLDKASKDMERKRIADADDYDQSEHLRLKTRVAEFYAMESEIKLLAVTAQQGLRLLLQKSPEVRVDIAASGLEPVEYRPQSVERYLEIALANQPTLRMAQAGAQAKRALADSKDANLWPDLVILGEANVADSNASEPQDSLYAVDPYNDLSAALLLGLRWHLDVPQRLHVARSARADARKAHQEAKVARDLMELKVRELHVKLENKRRLIEVFAESKKAAKGWLTANWDVYDAGFGNFNAVMDALVQFYSKRIGYLRHIQEHNVLVFELSRAIGADLTLL